MGLLVVKFGFLLLCTLYHQAPSRLHEARPISNLAQAFLFHQIPSQYSSFNEHNSTSSHFNSYSQNDRQAGSNRFDQASSFYAQDSGTYADDPNEFIDCPAECDCLKVAQIADCSNRSLTRVPSHFPKDIKRIRLERNNITELGPYAFQGLKRLQRIDLSNNKLIKIDPLAFAGGLQSLNSLILFSNKLEQLPANLFSELSQLQLLLLNSNSLQCINKELFQPLANLNLLSLYDNNIETLANGTFDGLKNIKTIHLARNPLVCDCNLRWLADYLELRRQASPKQPFETSQARCEGPARNQGAMLRELSQQRFTCEGTELARARQIGNQCASPSATQQQQQAADQSCPIGCVCSGATVDCSRATSLTETARPASGLYELPDVPDDVPVYVTRMRINDNRIKRIRQTGLFRRLANSQKMDLGNNKIIDIEDNAINGAGGSTKPERVVFVLLENEHCSASSTSNSNAPKQPEDPCSMAPKVNAPNFDSPCYNGGSCISNSNSSAQQSSRSTLLINTNYSCLCPPGFAGPLCEINIDDCIEHQCQNGAMCVDGINSYKCLCRDPTTTGEYCEQLNSFATSSANSIAPIALPMIASNGNNNNNNNNGLALEPVPSQLSMQPVANHQHQQQPQQIIARSAEFRTPVDLSQQTVASTCKRVTQRKYYQDGNGCQSVRVLKLSECAGTCGGSPGTACCLPAKVKRRRIRMQCNDGASYVKTIDLVKKCACSSSDCPLDLSHGQQQQHQHLVSHYNNATQEDQLLQITRLDAVD